MPMEPRNVISSNDENIEHSIVVIDIYARLLALVLLLGMYQQATAQTPTRKTTFRSMLTLPNGDSIESFEVADPIKGENLVYSRTGYVRYATIVLHKKSGGVEVLYRSPSSPGGFNLEGPGIPIHALVDASRAEVCKISHGYVELFRFVRKDDGWRFLGRLAHNDFDVGLSGVEPPAHDTAKQIELADWGTLRVTTLDGSIRTLTIDSDGGVLENGQPFEYKRSTSRPDGFTTYERDKFVYRASVTDYYEPRDANGVMLIMVEGLRKQFAKSDAEKAKAGGPTPATASHTPLITAVPSASLNVKQSPAPKALEAKPAAVRQVQPASTPWLVWGGVIVAAIGLLWLALKKRK